MSESQDVSDWLNYTPPLVGERVISCSVVEHAALTARVATLEAAAHLLRDELRDEHFTSKEWMRAFIDFALAPSPESDAATETKEERHG